MSGSVSQSLEMSSDKNLVPKCVSKNSHSFDDRICDDLSEVLLQFLPIKHKLRLECVSKQFQRTVFQKQCKVTLVSSIRMNTNNEIEYENNIADKVPDKHYLKSIETLLKKCLNIQTMSLDIENRIFKSTLPLISKYCDYLQEFKFFLDDWSEPELNEEFYRRFGPKLKYIRFRGCRVETFDYNLCPNLYSIGKFFYPETISLGTALRLNLKNLRELNIDISEQNQHLFPGVLQKFHKIRHLGLYENLHDPIETFITVYNAFHKSPVLQNLIQLKFSPNSSENGNQYLDSMKQLAKKFPKLKSIEICTDFSGNSSDLRKQLSPLKSFPDLKRLELWLYFQDINEHFSFESFEELSNITHLELWFDVRQHWRILSDIKNYLPKLQYLSIRRQIITDVERVTQIAESLSKLSSLHTIDLWLKYPHISELMKAKIAEKCRKIRKIDI